MISDENLGVTKSHCNGSTVFQHDQFLHHESFETGHSFKNIIFGSEFIKLQKSKKIWNFLPLPLPWLLPFLHKVAMKNVAKNWTNANLAVVPVLPAGRDATKTITNALTDVNFCSSYRILYRNKYFSYAFQKPLSLKLVSSKPWHKTSKKRSNCYNSLLESEFFMKFIPTLRAWISKTFLLLMQKLVTGYKHKWTAVKWNQCFLGSLSRAVCQETPNRKFTV